MSKTRTVSIGVGLLLCGSVAWADAWDGRSDLLRGVNQVLGRHSGLSIELAPGIEPPEPGKLIVRADAWDGLDQVFVANQPPPEPGRDSSPAVEVLLPARGTGDLLARFLPQAGSVNPPEPDRAAAEVVVGADGDLAIFLVSPPDPGVNPPEPDRVAAEVVYGAESGMSIFLVSPPEPGVNPPEPDRSVDPPEPDRVAAEVVFGPDGTMTIYLSDSRAPAITFVGAAGEALSLCADAGETRN